MKHSALHIPLRFGLIITPLAFGCDRLDVGDFDPEATTSTSEGSLSESGNASTSGSTGSTTSGTDSGGAEESTDTGTTAGPGGSAPCDPLLQDCREGETCVWDEGEFRCLPWDHSGQFGDACEVANGCDLGLQCIDPESAGCGPEASGCCSPFCDLGDPFCPDGTVCVAWFDGEPPPGLDDVGVCRVGDGGSSESDGSSSESSGGMGVPSECDGLLQDCPDGEACVLDDTFECQSAGTLAAGEACSAANDCQVGLICVGWDLVPGCVAGDGRCCSSLCDLSGPFCPAGTTCVDVDGGPYLDNEDTGVCSL